MKRSTNKIKCLTVKGILLLLTVVFVFPACQERLDEMNMNPNAITSVPVDYLFTTAVRETFRMGDGGGFNYSGFDLIQVDFGGQHAHLAVSWSSVREVDNYEETYVGDLTQQAYKNIYGRTIKYCRDILLLTDVDGDQENELQHALTDVVAVMNFSRLTDLFGDIPYFEAGLGKEGEFLPVYDSQQEIYSDMLEVLGNSLDMIKSADFSRAFPGADPMYNNDREGWVRFTNSLRLRLAMRARFADPDKYEAIISECLAEDLIEENLHNARLQHWNSDNGQLRNPWHKRYEEKYMGSVYNFNVSDKYVNFLANTSDPRLQVMVDPNSFGEFVGMPNGLNDVSYSTFERYNASILSSLVLAKDQYLYFMTASEIWFLRAEAALFNLGPGDANQLYQTGIALAMGQWGIEQTIIDNYLSTSSEGVLTGNDEEQFEQIGNQMWLAFVPNYIEAWFNIRRTGYPVIPQRISDTLEKGVTNGYMPTRLLYPKTTERTINGENMQEAIDRMEDGDHIYSRVWWDVRDPN